ncbi:MAG: isoleucine--tRNA ligase [Planctomycetia bacterium]|nr:isoleucine--tRNA ligase [Planctomycetia bacterium]
MFPSDSGSVKFPELEARVAKFWKEQGIYQKSLVQRAGAERFVFFEGPPTANGMPHPGHCLTRAIKDLFPRYQTMRGKLCERKAGWDTHGLPVEVEVCKELGIHSKEEIEAYGIEPFIHKCQQSVWRYMQEWERLTKRLGFWVNLDEAYVTYHQSYIESVWWSLKKLFDDGLLYQGYKIVWWWAQGGTALSAGEVGQGYREVADPSVYVRFPLLNEDGTLSDTDLLVWTTTPWTLPSNQFAAVNPALEYAVVDVEGQERKFVVAVERMADVVAKVSKPEGVTPFAPRASIKGSDLVGRRYIPPFDYYHKSQSAKQGVLKSGKKEVLAWRVVAADFVTTDSGTGVVHQAPAFGEVDFDVLIAEQARFEPGDGPELICAVAPDGKFTDEAPDYAGRWVKDCDKDISRELKRRGLLLHQEQYLHEYPFCWRAEEDPLIQYPRRSWFIRTSQFKDAMLANNAQINWLPEHIRDGRFGNFLETNVDWALSRERYWGTPLPIWRCEATMRPEAISSYDELLAKPGVRGMDRWEAAKREFPNLPEDLKVHKPYIDAITYESPHHPGARMRRVPDVIDCWYDSGAMPFAQWGYPHQGQQQFQQQFPADFISEALDQTRGWFYSQLAISTLLFGDSGAKNDVGANGGSSASVGVDVAHRTGGQAASGTQPVSGALTPTFEYPHPYRNCIVLGLMLGEDGKKMSKSKRNYREPNEIFDKYGADALRWYFFANQPPWTQIRYSEQAIKDSIPEFLLRLWNCYSFFAIYANIDQFDPATALAGDVGQLTSDVLAKAKGYRKLAERGELDRWIMGELHRTAAQVVERMDAYDNYGACGVITEFVDALSNWYVRRSRDRFWSGEHTPDKLDAYWTLYECLVTTTKLIAPFTPFLAEGLWQNLVVSTFGDRAIESVHLADYPTGNASAHDAVLSERMKLVREIVSLGRNARMASKLKVRQPLGKVEVILADRTHQAWLEAHGALVCDELNVKAVDYAPNADQYISYTVLPDLKRLGPKLGKRLPALKSALAAADPNALLKQLETNGVATIALADGEVSLDREELQVRLQAKEGWAAAQGALAVVVLSTELTPALLAEGLAREFVHAVQGQRKDVSCEYTDRIEIGVGGAIDELRAALQASEAYILGETLGTTLSFAPIPGVDSIEVKIGDVTIQLYVKRLQ